MKVAIDVSPLQSGHKVRGVGFYLTYLKRSLLEYYPENKYAFFTKTEEIPTDVDLVHYPYFDPFFLTMPFAKKYKTVVTVHDVTPLIFPKHFPTGIKGKFRWQIQKFHLQQADAILTDSKVSKKDIVTITKIPEEKVSVAYLAAGEEFRRSEMGEVRDENLRKKYNLSKKFILYVGDITWNKNVPRLVKAMKETGLPLVMVGKALVQKDFNKSNPWNKDLLEVQSLVEGDANIKMLGFVSTEDLVSLYNMATVFVFPSVYEGFGLPILEAMQSGCPVIVSKEGCMPEVAGDAAYYFDGYDTQSLIAAVKKVFSSVELQKELSKKGIEQAKKFSWKQTAQDTNKVYQQVFKQ